MGGIKEKEIELVPIGGHRKDNSATGAKELSRREKISKIKWKEIKGDRLGIHLQDGSP